MVYDDEDIDELRRRVNTLQQQKERYAKCCFQLTRMLNERASVFGRSQAPGLIEVSLMGEAWHGAAELPEAVNGLFLATYPGRPGSCRRCHGDGYERCLCEAGDAP
jgi:hypothetical protein